jgi:hypothetical protein
MFEPELKNQFRLLKMAKPSSRPVLITGGLIILLLLAALGYYYYSSFQKIIALEAQLKETVNLVAQLQGFLEEQGFEIQEQEQEQEEQKPIEKEIQEKQPHYSKNQQVIGEEGVKNLRIKAIRQGDHQGFYRIVFDLITLEGADPGAIPKTKAIFNSEKKAIEIEISGLGGNIANNPAWNKEEKVGKSIVISYIGQPLPSQDDKAKYTVFLNKETNFLLDLRLEPARIVLDIQE